MTLLKTISRPLSRFTAVAAAVLTLGASSAMAAGKGPEILYKDFKHEGVFGRYDAAQLRRGWQIYQEVCASCHGLQQVSYRNLGDANGPAFSEADVKAIAAEFEVETLDEDGEVTTRPATPADKIVSPFANEEAAKAANGGAYPPDLSLITKARTGYTGIWKQLMEGAGGSEYVYSLMLGYQDDPPKGFDVGDLNYNKYFPGHKIAMGPQLQDEFEYLDGSTGSIEQQAEDIAAFLTWTAQPYLVEKKEAGVRNIVFLLLLAVLLWFANRKLWVSVKKGEQVH